jgi:Lon protease-like protein
MFPLSGVLFPGGLLPLHIFEPRYLVMINEAIDDDRSFGVVLIERGSEVGGGEVRFDIGTRAEIVQAGILEGERMAVVAVGTERLSVETWLEDDPYPVAMTVTRAAVADHRDLSQPLQDATRAWRKVAALASELGADVGSAELALPEDPEAALWALCNVSPLEQIDRQHILEADDPWERAILLNTGLVDQAMILEARLAGGLA